MVHIIPYNRKTFIHGMLAGIKVLFAA